MRHSSTKGPRWPALNYEDWKATYETLHMWTQIVGKLRLCKAPWMNHSWHAAFYVTPLGLTTSAIPLGARSLAVDFDFSAHELVFVTSEGEQLKLPLRSETVAAFYRRFNDVLRYLDVQTSFLPSPNEVPSPIPFSEDHSHKTYNPVHVHQLWQILVRADTVLKGFRSNYTGKCSPVHFFWGSFDLAVTRFSGRSAPPHPGGVPGLPDRVTREAYSDEVSSCGFWPGNEAYPHAAFYSYAYPEPDGFKSARIAPKGAFYHEGLREFLLPYEEIRRSRTPEEDLLAFFQSTYRAAADLGRWDRKSLEGNPFLAEARKAFAPEIATRVPETTV